ncbi:MAG: antidote-toxin recognition MazE [bacterium]
MKSTRAKLFPNGGSQAVRLPKECRFPAGQREVVVRREGRRVVLETVDEWPAEFKACLGAWRDPIDRPPQKPVTRLANPFD